jgi:hypothetical protein
MSGGLRPRYTGAARRIVPWGPALMFAVKSEGARGPVLGVFREAVGCPEAAQGRGWSAETTVDQTLIRGLGTAW